MQALAVATDILVADALNRLSSTELLDNLSIIVPNGTFSSFIFNPYNGAGTLAVTAVVNEPGGGTSAATFEYALGNGNNFLTVTTAGGETLASLSLSANSGFTDFRQARISGASVDTAVPEPASLTLLGLGLAGMAGRRWRQRKRT